MATDYRKTKTPRRPWRPRDHAAFDGILASLKWEAYPNGQCGWEDRATQRFIDTGFAICKSDPGCPAMAAKVTFDLGPGRL